MVRHETTFRQHTLEAAAEHAMKVDSIGNREALCDETKDLFARLRSIARRANRAASAVLDADYGTLEVEMAVLQSHVEELDADYIEYLRAHGVR